MARPKKATEEEVIHRSAPLREANLRSTNIREEEIRPTKKVRVRKGGGMTDRLYIPPAMIPEDIDLQWVTSELLGMPTVQSRQGFEINGWEPVSGQMWNDLFDGMFMPRGHRGEINVGGLVLMWRPIELTLEAREEDRQAAMSAVHRHEQTLLGGAIKGVTLDTSHPSARAKTRLTREVVSGMPIPKD